MTSAPSLRLASRPAWNAAASPLLFVRRTVWSTPSARATSTVRSVEPSSITSHSTSSTPGICRGRSARVAGSWSSSLKQGIWMMSFMGTLRSARCPVRLPERLMVGLQDVFDVALANLLRLPQKPDLGEPLVAAPVEDLADVARPHALRLPQHPDLLRLLDLRGRGPADGRGREEDGALEPLGRGDGCHGRPRLARAAATWVELTSHIGVRSTHIGRRLDVGPFEPPNATSKGPRSRLARCAATWVPSSTAYMPEGTQVPEAMVAG